MWSGSFVRDWFKEKIRPSFWNGMTCDKIRPSFWNGMTRDKPWSRVIRHSLEDNSFHVFNWSRTISKKQLASEINFINCVDWKINPQNKKFASIANNYQTQMLMTSCTVDPESADSFIHSDWVSLGTSQKWFSNLPIRWGKYLFLLLTYVVDALGSYPMM